MEKKEAHLLVEVATAKVKINEDNLECDVSVNEGVAEIFGTTEEEIRVNCERKASKLTLERIARNEAEKRGNGQVGYSRAYAQNWGSIFGKKNKKETLN